VSKQSFAGTPVVLDTCVLLLATKEMFKEINEAHPGGAHFVIPQTVVEELAKKGVGLEERARELGFSGRYEIFENHTLEVTRLATRLPIHYPDNLIVASAMVAGTLLLTFDDTMKTIALCYGVSVAGFSPWHAGLSVWRLGDDVRSEHARRELA
jgi:rRNA-processing protein FCF1